MRPFVKNPVSVPASLAAALFSVCAVPSALAVDVGAYAYAAHPVPMLTVNGRSDNAYLYPGQPLTVHIGLDTGAKLGQPADWWLLSTDGSTISYYDVAAGWRAGMQPSLQGPLASFAGLPVFNTPLQSGQYGFYFGVDTPADGGFNPSLRYAGVTVSIPSTGNRVLYVSPSGDNANPGSQAQPWGTIKYAADNAQAGDIVWVRGGTYKEQLAPAHSGTPTQPIVFAAFPGETVTLEAQGLNLEKYVIQNTPFDGVIHINERSNVWIVGFKVQHSANIGIMVYNSDNILIQDNSTYDTCSSGIAAWRSRYVIIDGNEVNLANTRCGQENISIGEDMQHFEIRYNNVHHSGSNRGANGIDIKDGSSNGKVHHNIFHSTEKPCVYIDGWDKLIENIDFYQNIIHDCKYGMHIASEQGGTVRNVRIYNNLFYQNEIFSLDIGSGYHTLTENVEIINNTFYTSGFPKAAAIVINNRKAKNVLIRNNLLAVEKIQISVPATTATVQIDHNLFVKAQGTYNSEKNGTDFVLGDPLFVNPSAGDFRIQAGSPAIGIGSADSAPAVDLTGLPRL